MENKPINYLKPSKKNQKNYSTSAKSNNDYKEKLELLALDSYRINEKLKDLMLEVSSIIKISDCFIVTNKGDIINFEFTNNKNKTYDNLFKYYHSRTYDYDEISKHIHKFNETLEKLFNQKILPPSYNNVINNMSIEIESIYNGKSILDSLFKELGDKINEIYNLNFKNKNTDHFGYYRGEFYFSNQFNTMDEVNEINYLTETLPISNETPTLIDPYDKPTLSSNMINDNLVSNINQQYSPVPNYNVSNKYNTNSINGVVNTTLIVGEII